MEFGSNENSHMQTNPYEPPASANVEMENSGKIDNSEGKHRSVVIRILSAVGIIFVIVFEAWNAVTNSIQWQDWVHFVCAAATISFLFSAYRSGHWRILR